MSENQSEKSETKRYYRRIVLTGAAATAIAIVNLMSSGGEAPSQAVLFLKYLFLAGGLVGLIGGLFLMTRG